MWWGVLSILLFNFCEQLAQLNEGSEYNQLADFVDYDEESEFIPSETHHHVAARRKWDPQGVVTPMAIESNAIEDTTIRSSKLDQNIISDVGTTRIASKSDLDDASRKYQTKELHNIDVKEDKDIDVINMLKRFIEKNRDKIIGFAKQRASSVSTTVKEASITSTLISDTSIPMEDKSKYITGSKSAHKVITWGVESDTPIDLSVSLEGEYLERKKESSSSVLTTQHDTSTSETTSAALQTISFQTKKVATEVSTTELAEGKLSTEESTTALVIRSEEASSLSTIGFSQDTVNMPVTTKVSRKKAGRWDMLRAVTIPTISFAVTKPTINFAVTKPTINYADSKMDVPKLLALLDSVADDSIRFNLTNKFNESLQKYNIPTCQPMPTTEPVPTLNFNDAPVVAKCFVCGLDVERVPYSSACADAFAGDFIPLVPIDAKARGQIARFRKYCRYLDVNRTIITEDEPHSVFGKFERGCSVRWVDLTGIYTQRSCRNRRRAVMGKHFASKRMAKLEMALKDVDNGCIISPMASLLPVSRGISLYARFHACVCTGTWCNKAVVTRNWITNNVMMFIIITYVN